MIPASFSADPSEALSPQFSPRETPRLIGDARCFRLEFTSHGDRVPGRLLLPARPESGPFPLILLQHGVGGSKDADYIDRTAAKWIHRGAALASIDFPLHGERSSAKMTGQLIQLLSPPHERERLEKSAIWTAFVQQAVVDLRRTLDALRDHSELDFERVAYAAWSLGSIIGGCFCGVDSRPVAAALAIGGGGFGAAEVDPVNDIGNFAPRPLLFVNAENDEAIPRASTEALFRAAGENKKIQWYSSGHADIPPAATRAMWDFLSPHIGLEPASEPID